MGAQVRVDVPRACARGQCYNYYRRSSRLRTPAPVPITASAVGAQKASIHLSPLFTPASSFTSSTRSSAKRCSSFASS